MQLLLMPSLVQRILWYLSQMLVGQLAPGQKYSSLKRVISVLILDKVMFPQDNLLHHRFRFADQNAGFELTDLMEVHVLELPKARKKKNIDSSLDAWLKFLGADRKEEFMQLAEHDPGVRSACMVLKDLSADEETRLQAEMREKAWRDEMDRLEGAIGLGREQGIGLGKKEVARNLLRMNLPLDQISEATGLTREEISSL